MNRLRSEAGFTLMEVLVAFGIMAIGILGVNALIMSSSEAERIAAGRRTAGNLAMQKMDEIKAYCDVTSNLVTEYNYASAGTIYNASTRNYYLKYEFPCWDPTVSGETANCEHVGSTGEKASALNVLTLRLTVGWLGSKDDSTTRAQCTADPAQCPNKITVTNVIFRQPCP